MYYINVLKMHWIILLGMGNGSLRESVTYWLGSNDIGKRPRQFKLTKRSGPGVTG